MSGHFSQFDDAVEEFRRGNSDQLNDHKTRMISTQDGSVVNDPLSKGMLENFLDNTSSEDTLRCFK